MLQKAAAAFDGALVRPTLSAAAPVAAAIAAAALLLVLASAIAAFAAAAAECVPACQALAVVLEAGLSQSVVDGSGKRSFLHFAAAAALNLAAALVILRASLPLHVALALGPARLRCLVLAVAMNVLLGRVAVSVPAGDLAKPAAAAAARGVPGSVPAQAAEDQCVGIGMDSLLHSGLPCAAGHPIAMVVAPGPLHSEAGNLNAPPWPPYAAWTALCLVGVFACGLVAMLLAADAAAAQTAVPFDRAAKLVPQYHQA